MRGEVTGVVLVKQLNRSTGFRQLLRFSERTPSMSIYVGVKVAPPTRFLAKALRRSAPSAPPFLG